MDLIYSVTRKTSKYQQNNYCLNEGSSFCTISSQNIVAFTTSIELDDISGKSWGSHVYVADLNAPWQAHKILSNKDPITQLQWDLPGDKLLVGDTEGTVQIWTFKEHVLNDWTCLGRITFNGEHILEAAFFHNGKKISLLAEKKDTILYNEKFNHLRFAPSVRHFGGRPIEGCLVITITGMIGVLIITRIGNDPPQLTSTTHSLGSIRQHISAADICYGKNGHFLVAVSSGKANLPIQCYRVSVQQNDYKCIIMSQALPSFFLQALPGTDNFYREVVQLKFVVREDADSLVVAVNNEDGDSLIEVWELREKVLPVHQYFANKPGLSTSQQQQQLEPFKTVLWQHQAHFVFPHQVTSMTTSKLSITTSVPPHCLTIVSFSDGSIHCLYGLNLKQVASNTLATNWRIDEPSTSSGSSSSASKKIRLGLGAAALDLTWTGSILVATDTKGQLYLYRLAPVSESVGGLTVTHACALLEFCLVTGLDWWDVLIALRPPLIETVCERFNDTFLRQLSAVQQFYYVRFLNIKTSLYRLTSNGQAKAADLTSLLMLHSVATAFKSLLRPSELTSHDKGPAESLAAVINEPLADVDKLLLHLEAKEFTVEPVILQSLQQLIQWVSDLALHLLARLPEHRHQPASNRQGHELLRDFKALNTLRELLVLIRIWGLLRQSCLPVFVRSTESLDVLAHLFKLLSRLVQSSDTDEALIDDCLLLPNQVMVPPLYAQASNTAVAGPPLFYQTLPIQLEYGLEPECLQVSGEASQVEGGLQAGQILDSIRHLYLGKSPLQVKQCARCGDRAQVHTASRTMALKAWDLRWARSCRCGGRWSLVPLLPH